MVPEDLHVVAVPAQGMAVLVERDTLLVEVATLVARQSLETLAARPHVEVVPVVAVEELYSLVSTIC